MRPKGGNRERLKRSQSEAAEISLLESRIAEVAPASHKSSQDNLVTRWGADYGQNVHICLV